MSIRLKLDFKQTCSTVHESTTLNVEEWQTKTIQDVKNIIESTLSIPCCDQRLYYPQEHLIFDNQLELKSLYLRDGDELFLEYVSVINIKDMDVSIDKLLRFAQEIDRLKEENVFDITDDNEQSEFPDYAGITSATQKLAFNFFLPWKNPVSLAQRHYFVHRGGFAKFLEVFKFAQHRYRCIYDHNADKYVVQHSQTHGAGCTKTDKVIHCGYTSTS